MHRFNVYMGICGNIMMSTITAAYLYFGSIACSGSQSTGQSADVNSKCNEWEYFSRKFVSTVSGYSGYIAASNPVASRYVNVVEAGADNTGNANSVSAFDLSIGTGGNVIVVPPGTYRIDPPGIDLKSNTTIIGIGNPTLEGDHYIMSVNRGTGGSAYTENNIDNVKISGITFLHMGGFSEHIHQLNANAVSNLTVEGCTFRAFRGDGIYIGSSNVAGTERHNKNVIIHNNVFDGLNGDNRNGISVIDVENLLIDNNYFVNTTRSTMPGAICVEPDDTYNSVKCVFIRNNKIANSGNHGISVWISKNISCSISDIVINNNQIDNCANSGIYVGGIKSSGQLPQYGQESDVSLYDNKITNCLYDLKI